MIDVRAVLNAFPSRTTFCSVSELLKLAEDLKDVTGFSVDVAGESGGGVPIHHITCGKGTLKALIVGGPHAHEPIGSLSVFGLLSLLRENAAGLRDSGVEWHIIPCIDPDGAKLNEGWSQKPFSHESYMKHFFVQAHRDQVDGSFPIAYKKMKWTEPSPEAAVLKQVIDEIEPGYFFTLHNTRTGGAFYYMNRDVGEAARGQLRALLKKEDFPIQRRAFWQEAGAVYEEGMVEIFNVRNYYDYLEKTTGAPESSELLRYGGGSWDYLSERRPNALTFVAELGYARHPKDESERPGREHLRRFKLGMEASSKHLATALLEEWERTKDLVDTSSPFYRAITRGGGVVPNQESIVGGGMPLSFHTTRDTLFNPAYDRTMSEADEFDGCIVSSGFMFLRLSYQFVRLLKASPPSGPVRRAVDRLEPMFDEFLGEIDRRVDFKAFQVVECDKLARVQLGSGLIALNSMLG